MRSEDANAEHRTMRPFVRTGVLLVLLTAGQAASAANVLFSGDMKRVFPITVPIATAATPATLMITPASPAAGFTIRENAFYQSTSFSATFPGYPYFIAYGGQGLGGPAGPFAANALTSTVTLLPTNSQYPYVTATPRAGFIRMRPGPNGFGGPLPVKKKFAYAGLIAGSVGYYDFFIEFTPDYGGYQGGLDFAGYSQLTHTFLTTGNGAPLTQANVVAVNPFGIAITGTITASEPNPFLATYTVLTGMDARNPAGTTGTLQLVQARIAHIYNLAEGPPPLDGSATLVRLRSAQVGIVRTSLTFLPEPGQITLLCTAILTLGALWRLRSR